MRKFSRPHSTQSHIMTYRLYVYVRMHINCMYNISPGQPHQNISPSTEILLIDRSPEAHLSVPWSNASKWGTWHCGVERCWRSEKNVSLKIHPKKHDHMSQPLFSHDFFFELYIILILYCIVYCYCREPSKKKNKLDAALIRYYSIQP